MLQIETGRARFTCDRCRIQGGAIAVTSRLLNDAEFHASMARVTGMSVEHGTTLCLIHAAKQAAS